MELEGSPHPAAIIYAFTPALPLHMLLLAQHLTVVKPYHCVEANLQYPNGIIRK